MKRMLLVTGSNVMIDTDLDALVHLIADEWTTTIYEPSMLADVPGYDAVLLSHAVALPEHDLAALVDATPDGRLFMHACDIQFTDRVPKGSARKPLTLIASLHPSIADTLEGRTLGKKWLAPLHPESRIVFAEYLAGLVHTIGPDIEAAAERAKTVDAPDVRAFYWGIKRPGVKESLTALGFGTDRRDGVFGAARSMFPKVRNLTREPKYDIDTWAPLAMHAEQVLLPYEHIKSEYQITRRLLECAYLAPDTTVVDPRLSEHVQRFLDPAEWHAYAKQVSGELLEILDEGLAVPDWSEYGKQVGTKHGELLRWVLANVDLADGWAIEFGTGDGTSTRAIAEHMPVMTFDVTTGLPEDWRPGFPAGMFAQKQIPNVPGSLFVNGLFEDTLPTAPLPAMVALLHVDCDLYSSTKTIYERAKDLLQVGTVLVYDELINYPGFEDHEHRAHLELLESWPTLRLEPIAWAHEAVAYRVVGV